MIDHLTLPVRDVDVAAQKLVAALTPLGYEIVMDLRRADIPVLPYSRFVGLGAGGKPDLWLRPAMSPIDPTHIALRVTERRLVDAFHQAAVAAGLRDDGQPGTRPHYHPEYYAAFVRDENGHSVEVVCHGEVSAPAARRATKKAKVAKKPAKSRAKAKKKR
jgi:catechol 2,3-dioxygenase-like lactoylglutathione lyase family enzyme